VTDDPCPTCGPGSDAVRALQGVCATPGFIPIMAAELVAVPCPTCNPGLYLLWSRGGLTGQVATYQAPATDRAATRWALGPPRLHSRAR